jgi:hypothetical protein
LWAFFEVTTRGRHLEVLSLYDRAIALAVGSADENARGWIDDAVWAHDG